MKTFLSAAFLLLFSGIAFAGAVAGPTPAVSVPTMMPWGMVTTATAMGASGLYFIFRRKK